MWIYIVIPIIIVLIVFIIIVAKISKIKKPEPNLDSLNKLFDSDIDTDTIGKKIFGI